MMYSSYKRTISYFPNTDMEAKGKPGPDELKLWSPSATSSRRPSSTIPTPPVSDGSGADRKLLKRAYDLLLSAGCKRDGGTLMLPSGKPLTIEFLDSNGAMQPHTMPFIQNLNKLGIQANLRIVDPAQLKSRTEAFDYDVVVESISDRRRQASPSGRLLVSGRRPERFAQSRRRRRSGGRCADRDDRRSEVARGAQHRLPRARPGPARRPLLGSDVVSRHGLGRPLGRVFASRASAKTQHRRAGNLVVGRSKGQDHWTLTGARRFALRPTDASCSPISFAASC